MPTRKKSSRPGAKIARAAGARMWKASKWTGRRVLAPGAKATGRFIAGRARRAASGAAGAIDDRRVRRAHSGSTRGAKIICACSDCKGRTWHDRDAFAAHMTGSSSQYMQHNARRKVPAPSTPRFTAVKSAPKKKPATTPAAERAAAFWNRSTPGMSLVAALIKAADNIAQTAPKDHEEFEQMLAGLSMAYLKIADAQANWAELLDAEVGLDPRVTAPLYRGSDSLGEVAKSYRDTRQVFRTVYAPQLEAASAGVRQPKSPEFFGNVA